MLGADPHSLNWPLSRSCLRLTGSPGDALAGMGGGAVRESRESSANIQPARSPVLHPRFARTRLEQQLAEHQERLRVLSEELLQVEERERTRLSMDLHDGLSQTIVLVKMKLGALRKSADLGMVQAVHEIEKLVDQASQTVRSITFELHPLALQDLGFEAATRRLAEHLGLLYGIEIECEDDGQEKDREPQHCAILFRSIRELLINAAKHARAHRILVRLERGEGCTRVTVQDDGIGMKVKAASSESFGLTSIRECLAQVGGSIQIESRPRRGTRICLRVPLATADNAIAR